MSIQYPPFVVKRPDGFIGVELSISDQLTPDEARELAEQLIVAAQQAEASDPVKTRTIKKPDRRVDNRRRDDKRKAKLNR